MTRAEDRREELEAFLWQHVAPAFADRRQGAAVVKAVLDRADACVNAVRPPRAPGKPRGPKKPPAVHYAMVSGLAACKAGDFDTRRWARTQDPQAVTCESCRKTPAWREAGDPS